MLHLPAACTATLPIIDPILSVASQAIWQECADRMASRQKSILVTLLAIGGLVAAGLVVANFRATRAPQPRPRQPSHTARSLLPKPAARDDSYVGSQACAECHKDIFEKFTASPMGQSMATVADAVQLEDYEGKLVEGSPHRQYRVTRDDHSDSSMHYEVFLDNDGRPHAEQGEEVSFVVGSGRRGRGYLIQRDGLLFQSPLTWYSHGNRWDLAPGYAPENHPRFSRRIGDGCLYCHAGRMHKEGTALDRYEENVFAELSIGCERCHGPGERHVQIQSDSGAAEADDPIVNPATLSISQRESVCNQCHLLGRSVIPRSGRGFFDFRPGDELEDIFVILSEEIDKELHGTLRAVNQVEQMRASECYQASQGKLGCISCHDAHSAPTAEQRAEHYRQRCLTCHEDDGCSVDLTSRLEPPANNSCIHCHMPARAASDVPHTSLTDHRVLRNARQEDPETEQGNDSQVALTVFDHADKRLPLAEIERARGIALMTRAWDRTDDHLAAEGLSHLLRTVDGEINERLSTIDDLPLLAEFAAGYLLLNNHDMAEACWRRMLKLNPNSETAWMGIAKVAEERQDLGLLGQCLDKVLELNPTSEQALALKVMQQHYSRDPAGAVQTAERLVEINPTNREMRKWLADNYRQQGEAEKSSGHQEFLNKMGAGKQAEAGPAN